MKKLLDGIHKFQSQTFYPQRSFFQDLAKGQKPETLFITCSDSRINPHLLTQTEPGELFMVRNAGNIVPAHNEQNAGEAGSIEYAVSVLGVKDIIICGHSHCGAMKGLLNPQSLDQLPAVKKWLEHAQATRHAVEHNCAHLNEEEHLLETIKQNVLVQLDNLRTIPAVKARLDQGDLQLHGWVYIIETAEVLIHHKTNNLFLPLFTKPAPCSELQPEPFLDNMNRGMSLK